ncbi:MAG: hypothetical protein M3N54_11950 [Acidobacteriota bacterium]|nr:hypothetical protein [Acidobacteriota bacterium]
MKYSIISFILVAGVASSAAYGQTFQRRADLRGGGNNNAGKCTVEVVVDGAVQVEIRGDSAVMRNLKGQPPQWRRFVCTSALPPNPVDFRFSGVDGRGSQQLIRDPRQGGAAVIQIDDPDNGSEAYTFDITWGNDRSGPVTDQYPGNAPNAYPGRGNQYPGNAYPNVPADNGRFRGGDRRFSADQAVELCQASVRQQAAERFRTNDVRFRQTNIDDQPGRNDWVVGTMEVRRQSQPDQVLKFSCSVDFADGRVRSAQIDPFYQEGGAPRGPDQGGGRGMRVAAIQNCERAVQEKITGDGYGRIDFGSVNFDDRPGRNDWVMGDFRTVGRYGPESMRFSCSVDLRDGDVRSVDVTTRQQ